jgi:hypothetical protein
VFAHAASVTDKASPLSDSSGGQRAFGLSEMDFERGAIAMGHGAFPANARQRDIVLDAGADERFGQGGWRNHDLLEFFRAGANDPQFDASACILIHPALDDRSRWQEVIIRALERRNCAAEFVS